MGMAAQATRELDTGVMQKNARKACSLLRAIANEKRLMILCHLVARERSVGELAALLDTRPSTVSQHLALLRRDGLVRARRDAQTLYYSLADGDARAVLETLNSLYCMTGRRTSKVVSGQDISQ